MWSTHDNTISQEDDDGRPLTKDMLHQLLKQSGDVAKTMFELLAGVKAQVKARGTGEDVQ